MTTSLENEIGDCTPSDGKVSKVEVYENLKDISDVNGIIEFLTDHNLIQLVTRSSLFIPLFLPAFIHYYPQLPYIEQNVEFLKINNNLKKELKKVHEPK